MSDGSTPILEVRDLRHSFNMPRSSLFAPRRRLQALRGISMEARKGETLAIVGESGCGKSTLAKALVGLIEPDSGEVFVCGKSVSTLPRLACASLIQPVFQDPASSLNPRRSVFDTVEQPLIVHGIGSKAERRQKVMEALDFVGLPTRTFRSYPTQLSGGQRQRVAIARALVLRPDIVVCDEPTSALDVSIQAQILNLLQDLQSQLGLTYIFISHDLSVVDYLANNIVVMYLGRIVESGPAEILFRHPRHPYTQVLLKSLLTVDPELPVPAIDLGTSFPDPLSPPAGCAFHPRCAFAQEICSRQAPPWNENGGSAVECHFPQAFPSTFPSSNTTAPPCEG